VSARPLHVLGAGGHAKVVIATARAAGEDALEVVDDNPALHGQHVLGLPVRGGVAAVLADPTARAVIAIGRNDVRARLADGARCQFVTLVHPSAISHAAALGAGTVVFAGAIIQPDATLGAHVIVNTGASIDHDGALGDFVHVAPGSRLAGNVTLGAGAFLGIGAVCCPGVTIGAWTTVGAGAAVVRDLPAGCVAVGVPARPRAGAASTGRG
jgi:sugar O-acyltransferase (sialic acid O-acetyltransferase NeuD family)